MKTLKSILIITLFCVLHNVAAQKFTLNNKSSEISWTGKAAFSAYSLTGSIQSKIGTITIEDDFISNLEISINMKSLDHKNKRLRTHLRGKDFFEVKKYETANFKVLKPVKIDNGKALLIGKMTIKNKSIEQLVPAIITVRNDKITLNFDTKIDRTKYGVKFNSPSFFKKMKENAIADKFTLKGKLLFE